VTLSRKDFFKQSFFSLGETLLKASETVRGTQDSLYPPSVDAASEKAPVPDENTVATADNQYCLAKNCGCYSCMERCEFDAIKLIPGVGIRINAYLCTGCGTCEYVCPVTPKAVRMKIRTTTIPAPSVDHAGLPS